MRVKIAIIGCGSVSEFRHAPEYSTNPNAEIIAFCDPNTSRAEKLAGKYGGRVYTGINELLEIKELDAVSVCTSNNLHASYSISALRAGKHVLCEKPMATNLEDAASMIREANLHNRTLMIGHNQRFLEAHITVKKLIESGELGKVLSFKTTFSHGGPEGWCADKSSSTWFFTKNAASMGVLGDLGIHKADLIRWLLGDEIDFTNAYTSVLDKKYPSGEPIDVEDNAICLLKTRAGIMGTLTSSWTCYGSEENDTVIYCERGKIRIFSDPEYQIIIDRRDGKIDKIKTGAIQTNKSQSKSGVIDAFINSIILNKAPEVTGKDGFEALSIIQSCIESSRSSRVTEVVHFQ